jgi:hypothetical protein
VEISNAPEHAQHPGFFNVRWRAVPEQRGTDEMPGNLAPSDIDEAVTSLTALMFGEVLQSLRSALSIKASRTA